jgi:hypothetical protein
MPPPEGTFGAKISFGSNKITKDHCLTIMLDRKRRK